MMRGCGARRAASNAGRWLLLTLVSAGGGRAIAESDPMAVPAKQWAMEASANELKVVGYGDSYLRYRIHIVDAKGDVIRDVMESKNGTVARLIMKEGRALTSEEDAAEHERLQAMLDSPAAFARHIKNDQSGKKMAAEMIKLVPEAMIFSYAAGQPQREGRGTGAAAEIVVDFKPDPAWTPPNMTSEALTGLEGRAWIDPKTHFMTRLECRVFRAVNFGMGLFAHIYPGGSSWFEQVRVSDQRWIFSHFVEHATVRALMLKTIKVDTEVQGSNFNPIGAMSYQDAISQLLATPLPSR